MKTFREFTSSIKRAVVEKFDDIASYEPLDEQTVHLVPHGGKGTHFKVVKGIKGQLEAGEVIHDSHVDDLHDVGIKTKIMKESDLSDEERAILEGVDIVDGEALSESAGRQKFSSMTEEDKKAKVKAIRKKVKPIAGG